MSELLPCPFTGAPARVTLNCRHQWGVVLGKLSFGPFQTKEEAIKAWNTRVEMTDEQADAILEAGNFINIDGSWFIN